MGGCHEDCRWLVPRHANVSCALLLLEISKRRTACGGDSEAETLIVADLFQMRFRPRSSQSRTVRIPAIVVCITTSFALCALTSCDSLMALKVDAKSGSAVLAADDELYVKRLIAEVASEHGLVQIENPRSDAIVTYRRNNAGVFFKNGALIALFRARNN